MTLDEIARLVAAADAQAADARSTDAQAAGTVSVTLGGSTLVLRRQGTAEAPTPARQPAPEPPMLRAPAAGLLRSSHPALAARPPGTRDVVAGEVAAFLQVGPCLRPVPAPAAGRVGPAVVDDGTLVGFGAPLLPWTAA